jgi:hypothetical protein
MILLVREINMFVGNANKLEMFSMKFGASFVFKSFSKFAFKSNLEK